jgi:hypothetical protein
VYIGRLKPVEGKKTKVPLNKAKRPLPCLKKMGFLKQKVYCLYLAKEL